MGETAPMTVDPTGNEPPKPRPSLDPERTKAQDARAVVAIAVAILLITVLQVFTKTEPGTLWLHDLYQRLYYIPILYAAYVFGTRGGALTAFAVSVPFALHAVTSLDGLWGEGFDNLLEIVTYFGVGVMFGLLRTAEERKANDLRLLSIQLEQAYSKLEERAIQLINIQDYTQSILRSITSGVLTVGPDGSVATANPAAERMLGMSEFDMVPKPIGTLFVQEQGLTTDVEKVLSGRLPLTLREVTLETTSGRTIHVQASTSRMRAVGGTVLGAVVTLEDISEIKSLTDQLIRADRLAALGELTAGVAHEVRNPLGVIRATVQLLEETRDPDRISGASAVITQEIDRLDRVVKALLDFGRPSRPTLVRVDIEDVLEDVVLFTKRFARQADVRIEQRFSGDLPAVFADPDQMKQVFLNLVTNAVQAMGEEGGTISIQTATDGDYVEVAVSDSGPGIPATDLRKVFDPFFTSRAGGTGLGLTIVHRIIDGHDGHIEVESGVEGTTFRVSLPILTERTEE